MLSSSSVKKAIVERLWLKGSVLGTPHVDQAAYINSLTALPILLFFFISLHHQNHTKLNTKMSSMSDSGSSETEIPQLTTPEYRIPEWFLTRNVKTPAELHDSEVTIELISCNSTKSEEEDSVYEVNGKSQPIENDIVPKYKVPYDEFFELRDITGAAFLRDQQGQLSPHKPSVFLRSQSRSSEEKMFFEAVAAHLAKEMDATLISATVEDLEDLGWEFSRQENTSSHEGIKDSKEPSSEDSGSKGSDSKHSDIEGSDIGESDIEESDTEESDTEESGSDEYDSEDYDTDQKSTNSLAEYYFAVKSKPKASPEDWSRNERAVSAILDAPKSKAGSASQLGDKGGILSGANGESNQTPLPIILHIRDSLRPKAYSESFRFLARFLDSVQERRKSGESVILLVNLSCRKERVRFTKIIAQSKLLTVTMTPPSSSKETPGHKASVGTINLRRLKAMLREPHFHLFPEGLLSPFADWSRAEFDPNAIGRVFWSGYRLQRATVQIAGRAYRRDQLQLEDIQVVLTRMGLNKVDKSTNDLNDEATVSDESVTDDVNGEATGSDKSVKNELSQGKTETWSEWQDRLKRSLDKYESKLVSYIVNPGTCIYPTNLVFSHANFSIEELQLSFDDVIIDEDTKDMIQHVLSMFSFRTEASSSSLLDQVSMKGMLLYGPPGTGKTHLCRAIAKASGSNMLSVDPAAINDMWVGETEKLIKASFTLAAKLFPCVLFIDEIDSLFYRRSSGNQSWERSALTQFLQAMDGLAKNDNAPLVVVATNRPSDLDEAFLRRLPQKIFFKLPDEESRFKILELFLKKDDIDASVDVDDLASQTHGYSGSDLRTLCAQAVLIWSIEQRKARQSDAAIDTPSKLCLTGAHFDKALKQIRPSVSQHAVNEVTKFARRFSTDV
jgi:SpoVK/Ycf46/Vps4 family AAA+-type ATPase